MASALKFLALTCVLFIVLANVEAQSVAEKADPADGKGLYYRWGSSKCGANSKLVYNGFVGGGDHRRTGSAVNSICLPKHPVLKPYPTKFKYPGKDFIYGAEYEMSGRWDHEVPCAVCLSKGSTIMMIPAKLTCPPKWKIEYNGFLAAGNHFHHSGSEYVCIDKSKESSGGGDRNWDGKLFYHVMVQCGSLPCSIYPSGKILPCVVCSI